MSQIGLDLPLEFPESLYHYGDRSDGGTHGVVLTKPHIVELILDLAGYTPDRDLGALRLLEPSCGEGVFLTAAVRRLLRSTNRHERALSSLKQAITAYDIDPTLVDNSQRAVASVLSQEGIAPSKVRELVKSWIVRGDFLLSSQSGQFDAVVGNPPYIRIEHLDPALQSEYRRRYSSLFDRADLYVAFIERGLRLLSPEGTLSYICADRWVLNRYGAPLRRTVTGGYTVSCYIDLHRAAPFDSDVIAYPAIFAVRPGRGGAVAVASMKQGTEEECKELMCTMAQKTSSDASRASVSVYQSWFEGGEPWIISTPGHLDALRALESRFEPIERFAETKVGIGVATGNDKVYIVEAGVDIERDRLVPLVMRSDIRRGVIHDSRRYVINTFRDGGGTVDLKSYPRLARYLNAHRGTICNRHVSKKNPRSWFRTIDRVHPELVSRPKLLIPDIAGCNDVTLDEGRFYPHHNLYYVTSTSWDLEVLGALLSSRVALFFIWSYAVKMRGGYLRFQAQYLRRIRLPPADAISKQLGDQLRDAYRKRAFRMIDDLAMEAYGIETLPEFDFVDTRRSATTT